MDVASFGEKKCVVMKAQVSTARPDTGEVESPLYVPGSKKPKKTTPAARPWRRRSPGGRGAGWPSRFARASPLAVAPARSPCALHPTRLFASLAHSFSLDPLSSVICAHSLHGFPISRPLPPSESSTLCTCPPHPCLLHLATETPPSPFARPVPLPPPSFSPTPALPATAIPFPSHTACTRGTPPPPRPMPLNTLPSPLARTRPARPFNTAMYCCFSPQHVLPLPAAPSALSLPPLLSPTLLCPASHTPC